MLIFKGLRKLIYRHFKNMRWQAVFALLLSYGLSSWLLMNYAGESHLIGHDFLYWLVVTASTVGYGDLSPETALGKSFVAFYIIPFGLGLFALTVGKFAAFSAFQWRKGIMGLKDLELHNHIVVVGWNEQRTLPLLKLLKAEAQQNLNRDICLCVSEDMDNPMPGTVEFVRTLTLNDKDELNRASIKDASTIIIDCAQDDQTLSFNGNDGKNCHGPRLQHFASRTVKCHQRHDSILHCYARESARDYGKRSLCAFKRKL
ncbi:MAG: potassium channel family protein [Neptuniibacter sp.]